MMLRNRAYTNQIPVDVMWDLVCDNEWREAILLKSDELVLEMLFDALIQIQIRNSDKWSYQLPHFFASACEIVEDGSERRKLLFAYTISSSIGLTL